MKEERVVELAKTAKIVSETYSAHTGNWSWPRLKAFVDLIESDIRAELTPRKLPNVKSLEELARDEGDLPETSAYTPGPWVACKNGVIKGGVIRQYVNGESQDQIALAMGLDHDNDGSQEANASLIAAAPELLEALIELEAAQYLNPNDRDARKEWRFTIIKAKAAIAKATGGK